MTTTTPDQGDERRANLNKIARLLTHIEDVVDDENWERINPELWNAVSALSAAQPVEPDHEDFAWLVVQEACETEPADEDDPECIRILRRDLKTAVLAAFMRSDAAQPVAQEASKAVQHVLAERQRQIGMGWTPEHDDHHPGGDIARAAAAYCLIGEWTPNRGVPHPMHQARWQDFNILRAIWPSNWVHPNPKDKRTNLVRAGALILAEIERIDRKAAK